MVITLYFINWNDSFYLPFIAKHYGQFCHKIVMYDNYSTDESVKIAQSLGFEVRYFGRKGELNDQHYLDIKNNCWKEERSKSDFVIVCDADEFLCNPTGHKLGKLPSVKGFDMYSNDLSKESIFDIKTGFESVNYSKQIIFSPLINDINYVHGCHVNKATERTTPSELTMFHYRSIGGVNRLISRHYDYMKRMSIFNKRYKMGFHYASSQAAKIQEFNHNLSIAHDLSDILQIGTIAGA
jgi:hypothetical protein